MRNVTVPSHEQPPEDNLSSCRFSVGCFWIEQFLSDFVWTWSQEEHLVRASYPALILLALHWWSGALGLLPCCRIGTLRFSSSMTAAFTFTLLSLFLYDILPSAYHRFSFFSSSSHVYSPPHLPCTLEIGMQVDSVQGLGVGCLLRNTRASITC